MSESLELPTTLRSDWREGVGPIMSDWRDGMGPKSDIRPLVSSHELY